MEEEGKGKEMEMESEKDTQRTQEESTNIYFSFLSVLSIYSIFHHRRFWLSRITDRDRSRGGANRMIQEITI